MMMTGLIGEWFERQNLKVWAFVAILVASSFALSVTTNLSLRSTRNLVVHSHQVIEAGKDLLIALDDAETGQRGYLLVASDDYLSPFVTGKRQAATALAHLESLVADNQVQAAKTKSLRNLVAAKLSELDAVLEANRQAGSDAAIGLIKTNSGKGTMDQIREILSQTERVEKDILAARDRHVTRLEVGALGCAGFALFISLLCRLIITKFGSARKRAPTANLDELQS